MPSAIVAQSIATFSWHWYILKYSLNLGLSLPWPLITAIHHTYSWRTWFCYNFIILKGTHHLNFNREFFLSKYVSNTKKLSPVYPPFKFLVGYFASPFYLNIGFISFISIKMKVLTDKSYKQHVELYTEIPG